ncbi:MAG: TetR/AcrR family transcriptional regulator [Fulvivirga sp.]|uniref:TetR/AcrR family transcriptional regulator n=1 Tax=Fulvivirga sp. TaxID=1931237 RepID=UPI0032EF4128
MSDTRETLLKIAGKAFSKYGFSKTSMDDIAKTARKAKGSLYYHFESKDTLFKEVVAAELKFLKEELTVIFQQENTNSCEVLRDYMLKRMLILKASINYQETLRPEFYEFYEFLNDVKTEMDAWEMDQIEHLLNKGLASGELELPGSIRVYAEVLVMLLKGLETPFFLQGEYDRLEAHFDNLIAVISKGISK